MTCGKPVTGNRAGPAWLKTPMDPTIDGDIDKILGVVWALGYRLFPEVWLHCNLLFSSKCMQIFFCNKWFTLIFNNYVSYLLFLDSLPRIRQRIPDMGIFPSLCNPLLCVPLAARFTCMVPCKYPPDEQGRKVCIAFISRGKAALPRNCMFSLSTYTSVLISSFGLLKRLVVSLKE